MIESEIFWLSQEKIIEVETEYKEVRVRTRVVTLSCPEGRVGGFVWPKITYGEWLDVPVEDEHEI